MDGRALASYLSISRVWRNKINISNQLQIWCIFWVIYQLIQQIPDFQALNQRTRDQLAIKQSLSRSFHIFKHWMRDQLAVKQSLSISFVIRFKSHLFLDGLYWPPKPTRWTTMYHAHVGSVLKIRMKYLSKATLLPFFSLWNFRTPVGDFVRICQHEGLVFCNLIA